MYLYLLNLKVLLDWIEHMSYNWDNVNEKSAQNITANTLNAMSAKEQKKWLNGCVRTNKILTPLLTTSVRDLEVMYIPMYLPNNLKKASFIKEVKNSSSLDSIHVVFVFL